MAQNTWFQISLISKPHIIVFFLFASEKHNLSLEANEGQDALQSNC